MIVNIKIICLGLLLILSSFCFSQTSKWLNLSLTKNDYSITSSKVTGIGIGFGLHLQKKLTNKTDLIFGLDFKVIKYSLMYSSTHLLLGNKNLYIPIALEYSFSQNPNSIVTSLGINSQIQGKGKIGWSYNNYLYTLEKKAGVFPLIHFGLGYKHKFIRNSKSFEMKFILSGNIGIIENGNIEIIDTELPKDFIINQTIHGNFMNLSTSFSFN
jgi:hypothetical protein